MEKILSINTLPNIYSYTHTAYKHSILESGAYQNKFLFQGCILEDQERNWREYSHNVDVKKEEKNGQVIISGNPYKAGRTFTIYHDCMEIDEISVKINYFGVTNLAFINLFLSGEDDKAALEKKENIFVYYINRKLNLYYNINDCYHSLNYKYDNLDLPIYLKLAVKSGNISLYTKTDMADWVLLGKVSTESLPFSVKKIGLQVDLGENLYYNWIFMNYIQLRYTDLNVDGIIHLDYDMYPMKNYQCDFIHYFLDIYRNTYDEVLQFYKGLGNYIRYYLLNNQYIEILLDEFYIPNRWAYNHYHYMHSNLIFGYSDREQVYYVLGFHTKMEVGKIPYSLLNEAADKNETVKRYAYNCNNEDMDFNLSFVKHKMQEYASGINSSFMCSDQCPMHKDIYGMGFLEKLKESRHLLQDFRISYLIAEHNKLMRQRIEFIFQRNLISVDKYMVLHEKIGEVVNETSVMLALVLKSKLSQSDNLKTRILERLDKVIESEKSFYSVFLSQ